MKDFISIKDLSFKEMREIFCLTDRLKKEPVNFNKVLAGKTLALIFQKPSNRTKVSFEVGMYQLGGYSIYLGPDEINLGVRESIEDVAKTLSRYVDGVVIRTFEHKNIIKMAEYSAVAVINGLSDLLHPCQAMADIYTIRERFSRPGSIRQKQWKGLTGVNLAYVGDGNNVAHSLLYGCSKAGINLNLSCPCGFFPKEQIVKEARAFAKETGCRINLFDNPQQAVLNADVIYTDVWASMGQEREAKKRKKAFRDFQVNQQLVLKAKRGCLIMHCLPAHRGEEITGDVIDSGRSIVFEQAENRLHVQKAILIKLLG